MNPNCTHQGVHKKEGAKITLFILCSHKPDQVLHWSYTLYIPQCKEQSDDEDVQS